ncbi:PPE family protein [Mycobacterium heckeshornense]|uniref:PPE family protein n=1 Tax=Mycobacterium TaxID=1763 RepID=UPI00070500CE|nr:MULTISPECIES: PPE family protein [Mycobacterium]MCV7034869.1 PPE family protein [Mycobacterium heckeshornense]
MGDYEVPPEINSGRMYAGPGSSSLVASAAAWQALSAELGSAGAAFSAVVTALAAGSWLGPSSISMAAAAAPYVVWMIATAAQCEEAAAAAGQAATAFEGARAGVVPPPVIEANRDALMAAIGGLPWTAPAVAALEAEYDEMWAQDTGVMYGMAGDFAGVTGSLVPFTPPMPNTNPAGLAAQAASVGQSAGQAAGQQSVKFTDATSQVAGLPAGVDAQTMLTMGPQLISMVPQTLQGFSSPLSSGLNPASGLGQFQSLLSPFLGVLNNPALMGMGTGGAGVASGLSPGLSGLGGAASAGGSGVEALAGRAASLGGLSVPATWTAGAAETTAATAAAAPVSAPAGAAGSSSAVPASTSGGGMYGGAPMAAGMGGRSGPGGPRYGTPIKVTRRR